MRIGATRQSRRSLSTRSRGFRRRTAAGLHLFVEFARHDEPSENTYEAGEVKQTFCRLIIKDTCPSMLIENLAILT